MGCISSKEDPEAIALEKEARWSILLDWLKSAPGADQKIKNLFVELDKGDNDDDDDDADDDDATIRACGSVRRNFNCAVRPPVV